MLIYLFYRQIEEYIYELVYEVNIDVRLIDETCNFPYKYYFKKKDNEGKYEHYTRAGKTGEGVNRLLSINKKYESFGKLFSNLLIDNKFWNKLIILK